MIRLLAISKFCATPGGGRRLLIARASAQLPRGSRTAIIGAPGSGKSVLARIIGRALQPDSGAVTGPRPVVPVIGYSAGLNPHLSGQQNVGLLAALAGADRAVACAFVREFAGLGEMFAQPVQNYTPAQRSRLAFSFSYAVRSPVLIADELLAAGDAGFREDCEMMLEDRIAGGATLILMTSNAALAARHCQDFYALAKGRLFDCADADEALTLASLETEGADIHA